MSTFGCEQKLVKTRKIHKCETCGRIIPIGQNAYHTGGMFQGDWQDWYQCAFCECNSIGHHDEYLCEDAFKDWIQDNRLDVCPTCASLDPETGKQYWSNLADCDWSNEYEDISLECPICKQKWHVHIGFEARSIECLTPELD